MPKFWVEKARRKRQNKTCYLISAIGLLAQVHTIQLFKKKTRTQGFCRFLRAFSIPNLDVRRISLGVRRIYLLDGYRAMLWYYCHFDLSLWDRYGARAKNAQWAYSYGARRPWPFGACGGLGTWRLVDATYVFVSRRNWNFGFVSPTPPQSKWTSQCFRVSGIA